MPATIRSKTFAVYAAQVAAYGDGTSPATWVDVPVIVEANLTLAITEALVTDGEGNVLHIWYHSQRGNIQMRTREVSFRVLEIITGVGTSSMPSGEEKWSFGREEELTPPAFRTKIVTRAVNQDGTLRGWFIIMNYKCRGVIQGFNAAETTPGEFTFQITLEKSTRDDLGNSIPSAFGHVRSLAASYT